MVGVCVEKDGESGGRFPTVRHAHLLGLIGRSHFPAQAQGEESEDNITQLMLAAVANAPNNFGQPYDLWVRMWNTTEKLSNAQDV